MAMVRFVYKERQGNVLIEGESWNFDEFGKSIVRKAINSAFTVAVWPRWYIVSPVESPTLTTLGVQYRSLVVQDL